MGALVPVKLRRDSAACLASSSCFFVDAYSHRVASFSAHCFLCAAVWYCAQCSCKLVSGEYCARYTASSAPVCSECCALFACACTHCSAIVHVERWLSIVETLRATMA